jgi:AcrR family transcriptional regulator
MRTKSKKRLEIIKASEKRFIRHGLHKTTLDEIARDLRIGKSTLYHYFKSKEDLYSQTLENQFAEYITEVRNILKDENLSNEDITKKYLSLRKTFPQSYKLLQQLMLLSLTEKSTPHENELLIKYQQAELKIIEEFITKLFPAITDDDKKRRTNRFAFLLISMAALNSFMLKVGVELPDEKDIDLLLKQIQN